MDRLQQIGGQLTGKSNAGGRENILQKNPDDVRPPSTPPTRHRPESRINNSPLIRSS